MTLSVCFIVRDEEEVICRALNSCAQFADEIIITDTGSKDKTVELAKKFTDKVYFFEWIDDFSAARNFCFDKASGDYVMWMDADDIVSYDNAKKIRALVDGGGFDMAYLLYVSGGDESFSYVRERILRRDMGYRFSGIVHEAISPRGKAVYSDARIVHKKIKPRDPARNLSIYRRAISRGVVLDERSLFYYGRELYENRLYHEAAASARIFPRERLPMAISSAFTPTATRCALLRPRGGKYSTLWRWRAVTAFSTPTTAKNPWAKTAVFCRFLDLNIR